MALGDYKYILDSRPTGAKRPEYKKVANTHVPYDQNVLNRCVSQHSCHWNCNSDISFRIPTNVRLINIPIANVLLSSEDIRCILLENFHMMGISFIPGWALYTLQRERCHNLYVYKAVRASIYYENETPYSVYSEDWYPGVQKCITHFHMYSLLLSDNGSSVDYAEDVRPNAFFLNIKYSICRNCFWSNCNCYWWHIL